MNLFARPAALVDARLTLPGRPEPVLGALRHTVFGGDVRDVPAGAEVAYLAMGCFWGAERIFWRLPGVVNTAVGYQGGQTPNPTYEEVCSGHTNHAEAVEVVFDPAAVTYERILATFFENHDPTQGMRQGNDRGTQYRSELFVTSPEQRATAERVLAAYDAAYRAAGYPPATTRITDAPTFYFAEDYHQQYLDKNPNGYCNHGPTGVTCPVGLTGLPAQTDILPPA